MFDFSETSLQATAPPSDTKGTNSDSDTCSLPHCHVTKVGVAKYKHLVMEMMTEDLQDSVWT